MAEHRSAPGGTADHGGLRAAAAVEHHYYEQQAQEGTVVLPQVVPPQPPPRGVGAAGATGAAGAADAKATGPSRQATSPSRLLSSSVVLRPSPGELELLGTRASFVSTLKSPNNGYIGKLEEVEAELAATKALNYVSEDSIHKDMYKTLDRAKDRAKALARMASQETMEFFADWLGSKRFYNIDDSKVHARVMHASDAPDPPPRSWMDNFRPHKSTAATARLRGAAIREIAGRIKTKGNIVRDPGVVCIASFPGKYPTAWGDLVRASNIATGPSTPLSTPKFSLTALQAAPAAAHNGPEKRSIACVFLGDVSSGLGQHTEDPEYKDRRCYCKKIYGERDFMQFGYLIRIGHKHTFSQRLKADEIARATNAVLLEDGASEAEQAAAKEMARANWEQSGRVAAWGCKWFQLWKKNIHLAVSRHQQLVVYYPKGQVGKGKVQWRDLARADMDPWDGIGLGGSQRVEVAYLDLLRKERGSGYDYLECDVKDIVHQKRDPKPLKSTQSRDIGEVRKSAWAATGGEPVEVWTGDNADAEKAEEEQDFDDIDSMYTDFSDLGEMVLSPMKWPFFVLLQILFIWPLWIAGKAGPGDFVAGLETVVPGRTDLRVNRDCDDLRPEVWRWLTYQWSHAGITHIGFNTFMLLFLGVPLEGFHGHFRFAFMFNVGVFGGACCFLVTDAHGPSLVGMSGGCYALLGMHMADIIMNFSEKAKPRRKLMILLLIAVVDFINIWLASDSNAKASPSHWAHLGGYIAGLLIGVVLGRNLVKKAHEEFFWGLSALVGLGLICFCVAWAESWPPRDIFQTTPWCWGKQILSRPHFNDTNFHCVRCDGPNCVADWVDAVCDTCIMHVSDAACRAHGGWEVTG